MVSVVGRRDFTSRNRTELAALPYREKAGSLPAAHALQILTGRVVVPRPNRATRLDREYALLATEAGRY